MLLLSDAVFQTKPSLMELVLRNMITPIRYSLGVMSLIYAFVLGYTVYCLASRKTSKGRKAKSLANVLISGVSILLLVIASYLVSWSVGLPIGEVLGFDPVKDITAGLQAVNALVTSTAFTNVVLLAICCNLAANRD